jgi:hypothetical protein
MAVNRTDATDGLWCQGIPICYRYDLESREEVPTQGGCQSLDSYEYSFITLSFDQDQGGCVNQLPTASAHRLLKEALGFAKIDAGCIS